MRGYGKKLAVRSGGRRERAVSPLPLFTWGKFHCKKRGLPPTYAFMKTSYSLLYLFSSGRATLLIHRIRSPCAGIQALGSRMKPSGAQRKASKKISLNFLAQLSKRIQIRKNQKFEKHSKTIHDLRLQCDVMPPPLIRLK